MTEHKTDSSATASAQVLAAEQTPAEALAEFYRKTWNAKASAEAVTRALRASAAGNTVRPGQAPTAVTFVLDDHVIGYLGSIPAWFWDGSGEYAADWLKGFMVLPEHRNGPVGHMLLRDMTKRVSVAGSLVVAEPARRLMQALGYRGLGALSNRVLVLRYGRLATRISPDRLGLPRFVHPFFGVIRAAQKIGLAYIAGAVAGAGVRVWHSVRHLRRRKYDITVGGAHATDEEIDALWTRVRVGLASASVRNARYLRWRYPDGPNDAYTFIFVRAAGQLEAIAVVRRPSTSWEDRLAGVKLATLSDIVFRTDNVEAGLAALAAAGRVARRLGADALLGSASHPVLESALKESGFVGLGGTLYFHLRVPEGKYSFSPNIRDWWLTRGDGSSDGGV